MLQVVSCVLLRNTVREFHNNSPMKRTIEMMTEKFRFVALLFIVYCIILVLYSGFK